MSRPRWSAKGFDIPLLIGGGATSRVHTAVKIHPNYTRGQTVDVTDASRAVGVVASLISKETTPLYIGDVRKRICPHHCPVLHDVNRGPQRRLTLGQARANRFAPDWSSYTPPAPRFLGPLSVDAYD